MSMELKMENKSRIAIAASFVWMALAVSLVLGTHAEAIADAGPAAAADAVDATEEIDAAAGEVMVLPALRLDPVRSEVPSTC